MPADKDARNAAGAGMRHGALRGREGFYRAARDRGGRWGLLDPAGAPVFLRAVHGVSDRARTDDEPYSVHPATRLRQWGFNAVGLGGDGSVTLEGFPYLAAVEFCAAATVIVAPGVRLPDVFDPEWPRLTAERAAQRCPELRDSADLLGWVTDSELRWGTPPRSRRPGLLQTCLALEPRFAAYHAAWEFVLAPHGGSLDGLAKAWGTPLPNKELLREWTRAETAVASRGYWRDDALWTREFARRYFTVAGQAIRASDPNHLIFGCRFGFTAGGEPALVGRHVLAECVYPAVDVAMPGWRELPEDDAMPLLPEASWADESFYAAATARDRRVTAIERMLRRGRAGLARAAQHRAVVGYVWSEWQDSPADRPPFGRGLLHADGSEAREHTELLAHFNARAESLRGGPKQSQS